MSLCLGLYVCFSFTYTFGGLYHLFPVCFLHACVILLFAPFLSDDQNDAELQAASHDFATASRAGNKLNSLSAMHRMAYRQRISNEIDEKLHRL